MSDEGPRIRNPLALDLALSVDSVDHYKMSDCRFYERCLDFASKRNWPQFHCRGCTAYEKIEDDHEAMILGRKLLIVIEGNN